MAIKRLLLGLLAFFLSVSAFADAPVTMYFSSYNYTWFPSSSLYETKLALCNAFATARSAQSTSDKAVCSTKLPDSGSIGSFYLDLTNTTSGATTYAVSYGFNSKIWCTNGMAPDTSRPLDQQCTPPNPCLNNDTKNSYVRSFTWGAGVSSGSLPTDDGKCMITNPTVLKCYLNAAGQKYCFVEYYQTTVQKDSSPPPATAPSASSSTSSNIDPTSSTDKQTTTPSLPPDPVTGGCIAGTVQYGIGASGDALCMGTGSGPNNPAPPPTTTTGQPVNTTNPDGSTSSAVTTTQQNTDGSVTTTVVTTTTATDGTVTTKTTSNTSNAASGGPGQQDSPDRDKSDICKLHPDLAVCRNSSVSGSCGQITCTGDAIQCATLRAAAIMQCAQKDDSDALKGSASKALGDQVLSGSDPMSKDIADNLKGTEVDMSHPALDQSSFTGSASCLASRSFSVLGHSVSVDFSELCNDVAPLRTVIMAVAFIVAYLIVSRSVLQS